MTLPNIRQKIKDLPDLPRDIFVFILISLVAIGSYGLNLGSIERKSSISELKVVRLHMPNNGSLNAENTALGAVTDGVYVGSKNGKTYHLPWCSGATRILEKNKVWFSSKEDATNRGYSPASNCKGI